MRKILFKDVKVNEPFFCDGDWYIKVDPNVPGLNTFINAVDRNDQSRGFWFEDNELVEQ